MKLIDLLNKIANNEEVPKRIKVFGDEFEFLYQSGDKTYFDNDGDYLFSDVYNWENNLNEEIEIIEEKPKKIETFNLMYPISKEYEGEIGVLVSIYNSILGKIDVNIQDLAKAVNYLLEKESDK